MFDLAWSEIAVIGLVAVVVLGPKELPQAMRTMAKVLRKMRNLTSELQGHMNEIVREAELDEVRKSIQKISTTSLSQEISKAADPTGEIQASLNEAVAPLSDNVAATVATDGLPIMPGASATVPEPAPAAAPDTAQPSAPSVTSVPSETAQLATPSAPSGPEPPKAST